MLSAARTLFIARAREDAVLVQDLSHHLLQCTSQWVLEPEIPDQGDDDTWKAIAEKAITDADAFLFVSSVYGIRSSGCRHELNFAQGLSLPLIHLVLDRDVLELTAPILSAVPTVEAWQGNSRTAAVDLVEILTALQ
jgi:TIR domain